jgi:hypothetical protein
MIPVRYLVEQAPLRRAFCLALLAWMTLMGAQKASAQFSHSSYGKYQPVKKPLFKPFDTGKEQFEKDTEIAGEPISGDIEQTGFFPPQRSMFPDTSPGRMGVPPGEGDILINSADGTVSPVLPWVWGGIGARAIPTGQKMAPNGVMFDPLFSLDLELNIALCQNREVYIFSATRFWGQKPATGITNNKQGIFDFSKREFDLTVGLAWNYWRTLEARVFAYSYNNLNRGNSLARPYGYNDGVAFENRWYYLEGDFLGVGYAPTKELIGNNGQKFQPSWFFTHSIWHPLPAFWIETQQLYWNTSLIGQASDGGGAKMWYHDLGYACIPFHCLPRLEFRTGTEIWMDLGIGKTLANLYIALDVPF